MTWLFFDSCLYMKWFIDQPCILQLPVSILYSVTAVSTQSIFPLSTPTSSQTRILYMNWLCMWSFCFIIYGPTYHESDVSHVKKSIKMWLIHDDIVNCFTLTTTAGSLLDKCCTRKYQRYHFFSFIGDSVHHIMWTIQFFFLFRVASSSVIYDLRAA